MRPGRSWRSSRGSSVSLSRPCRSSSRSCGRAGLRRYVPRGHAASMPLTRARWLRLTSGWSRSGGSGARGSRPSQLKSRVGSVHDEGDSLRGRKSLSCWRGAGRNRTDESRFCSSPGAPAYHSIPLRFAMPAQRRLPKRSSSLRTTARVVPRLCPPPGTGETRIEGAGADAFDVLAAEGMRRKVLTGSEVAAKKYASSPPAK